MCLFVMRILQINLMNFNCNFHVVYYVSRGYGSYNQNFTLIKQHFAIPQHHQVTINLLILSYQEIVLSIFQVLLRSCRSSTVFLVSVSHKSSRITHVANFLCHFDIIFAYLSIKGHIVYLYSSYCQKSPQRIFICIFCCCFILYF